MTTDLVIYKGRVKTLFKALTPAGLFWIFKTFERAEERTLEIDNEDAPEVVRMAREWGLEVDD